jgi:hypothetical protein
MSESIHDLSAEELQMLATKAIDAKATAYCTLSVFLFVPLCRFHVRLDLHGKPSFLVWAQPFTRALLAKTPVSFPHLLLDSSEILFDL